MACKKKAYNMIAGNANPKGLSPNFVYRLLSNEFSKEVVNKSLNDLLDSRLVIYSDEGKIKLKTPSKESRNKKLKGENVSVKKICINYHILY